MLFDLLHDWNVVNGLLPQVLAATAQGASKDFSNCQPLTSASLAVGAFGANATSLGVQIEESDDGSTNWTAISGMTFTAVTTSTKRETVIGQRTKRYVRANAATVAGATPAIAANVDIMAPLKYSGSSSGASVSPAG